MLWGARIPRRIDCSCQTSFLMSCLVCVVLNLYHSKLFVFFFFTYSSPLSVLRLLSLILINGNNGWSTSSHYKTKAFHLPSGCWPLCCHLSRFFYRQQTTHNVLIAEFLSLNYFLITTSEEKVYRFCNIYHHNTNSYSFFFFVIYKKLIGDFCTSTYILYSSVCWLRARVRAFSPRIRKEEIFNFTSHNCGPIKRRKEKSRKATVSSESLQC